MQPPLTFILEDHAVGGFTNAQPPTTDGDYAYEPYRGIGHLNLMTQLKASASPRCHYRSGSKRVEFSVVAHVKYGVLRLSKFQSLDLPQ